jgi:hypothetical protein
MATAAISKVRPAARPASAAAPKAPTTRHSENDMDETPARWVIVALMPVVIFATIAAIVFWLTLPLR